MLYEYWKHFLHSINSIIFTLNRFHINLPAMKFLQWPIILMISAIIACNEDSDSANVSNSNKVDRAQSIIDSAILKAGLHHLDSAAVRFVFRDKTYHYKRNGGVFEYQRIQTDTSGREIKDVLNNDTLIRYIDGKATELTNEWQDKYASSITSVIYFAFLPYKLNDERAVKAYLDSVEIHGRSYHKIKVSFEEKAGQEKPDDVFIYWFDTEDYSMDYLAYEFFTEKGGFRFREAYNTRTVEGIIFQDYHNYKPRNKDSIDLHELDAAFLRGELELLSEIQTEKIEVKWPINF